MIDAFPETTLLDRALAQLAHQPRSADELAREVLGLRNAPSAVASRLAAALLGGDPRAGQLPDGRWALVAAASGSPCLDECAFAVVDVETTGSRTLGDRVLEVGIVVVHGARREMVLDRLVNPGRPIPGVVSGITRITNDQVCDAPPFDEIADDVLAALSGRIFVAHNVRFDWGFVSAELKRTRGLVLNGPRLCTARLARRLVPVAESCGLDWLTQYFDLGNPARHRAGGDAWATAQLLLRLLDLAREKGARTLQDLEALQVRKRRKRRRKKRNPFPH
ncbi:MAG TPA: 3'-5' exonuclease [Gemmatimonadales bacterium]|nr:3'-5' exonuclease [Gemmatimonadales bacterium]